MSVRCLLSTTSGRLYPYHEDPTLLAHRRRLLHRAAGAVLDLSDRWESDLGCFRPTQLTSLTVTSRDRGRTGWIPTIPTVPWSTVGRPPSTRRGPTAGAAPDPAVVPVSAGLDVLGSGDVPAPGSYDTVVACLTLCTVPSLPRALEAIRTWMSPAGQLLVVEHVLGTGVTGLIQSALSPARRTPLADVGALGCRLDQDLPAALRSAGLRLTDCARFTTRIGGAVPVPCVAGVARAATS